jgi:hypothetical protein
MRHSPLSRGAVYQQLLHLSKEKKKKPKKGKKGWLSPAAQVFNLELMLLDVFKFYQQASRPTSHAPHGHPELSRRAAKLYADIREYQTSLLFGE